MKILITPDCMGWAIGNLVSVILREQRHRFNFILRPLHPRKVDNELFRLQEDIGSEWSTDSNVDLWHSHYYRSSEQAIALEPRLSKLPNLLTVHGHQHVDKLSEENYDRFTIATKWGVAELGKQTTKAIDHVPMGIDLDRLPYIPEKCEKDNVGYVGRVVPWKHLKEVSEACKELKYKVVGSGYVDKPAYWEEVDKSCVEFAGGVGRGKEPSMAEKDKLYERMKVFVMYSTGERESGTLPLLEAMSRGIPVMVTEQGMARDLIEDGENGVVFTEENFKEKLKDLMEDAEKREKLRKAAWKTVSKYNETKYGREMAKCYYKTLYPEHHLISVVIPTFERAETLIDVVMSIDDQDWPNKEVIVVDDGSEDNNDTRLACKRLKAKLKTPVIYKNTQAMGYNLAMARNMGALEALGEQLVFLDDRLKLDDGALSRIAKAKRKGNEKAWNWGAKSVKGKKPVKKGFVENFSWVDRQQFWLFGGFNERMDVYGGMSEDVRKRWSEFGGKHNYDASAKAIQVVHSGGKNRRSDIWKAKELIRQMHE